MDEEHDDARLREGEREGEVRDLPGVLKVDDAAGEFLEDPGEHGRRHREHPGAHVQDGGPLDPLDDDLHRVGRAGEEVQAPRVYALDPDDLEAPVPLLRRHLLESGAEEQAHQAPEQVLELVDGVLLGGLRRAEGDQAAVRVEPLSSHLLKEGASLPPPRVGLLAAEVEQEPQDRREARPQGEGELLLVGVAVVERVREDVGDHRVRERQHECSWKR
mmetsp:Transcript_22910/g.72551  ORF Transcript_22910/g.72551 Transcript_22910/m.72551 type:complete len:217 (+) Transcript_22910:1108-1758(+)